MMVIILVLLFILNLVECHKPACDGKEEAGDICKMIPSSLRPTQFAVGVGLAYCKTQQFESMSSSELKDYLKDHPVPSYVGPDGFYITDHHHLTYAVHELDPSIKLHIQVIENWSSMNKVTFISTMLSISKIWNYDSHDVHKDPMTLPKSCVMLEDDPYRTFSSIVRYNAGYLKQSDLFFCEFVWGRYLRQNISLMYSYDLDAQRESYRKNVMKAVENCKLDSYPPKNIAGWNKGIDIDFDCDFLDEFNHKNR